MDDRPEALLKSALEKIVYFEARSEQLTNDVKAAREENERLRLELAGAAQREIELRRAVAELEVRATRAHGEREELARMAEALRKERADLIGKLLEASRIHESDRQGEEGEAFDLAAFIAELRGEALALRGAALAPAPAVAPALAVVAPRGASAEVARSKVAAHAVRLQAEGRLEVSSQELVTLSGAQPFPGRAEETLFGFSVRELSAPDAAARLRAAERLKSLGHPAAAPALATALHGETEPRVQVALLAAFATFARAEGVPVVAPLLESRVPEVRVAALKALLSLDASRAGPHLAAAMKDPDRAVRRRASLLALSLSGDGARGLGEEAIRDADPEVRGLAALVLGASGAEQARPLLLEALRDSDRKVRSAAAQSLSRLLGEDVSAVVAMDDAKRRREVRRLAKLPSKPPLSPGERETVREAARLTASPSPQAPHAGSGGCAESLCEAVLTEVRMALRGRTVAELASAARVGPAQAQDACDLLVARGRLVRRGARFFAA